MGRFIMKIYTTFFILIVSVCKAQSPILPLDYNPLNLVEGAYYKDLNDELTKFTGTWKYTNGTTSFTIVFQKKAMFFNSEDNYYEDILIGEYKYIENGVEKVNTLPNLTINYANQYKYNIAGLILYPDTIITNPKKIELNFNDPEREYLNRAIRVKYIPAQGTVPAKIEVKWTGNMSVLPNENSPTEIRVPEQDYILEKQP